MGKDAGRRRIAVCNRYLGNHAFYRRFLIFAAKRHENGAGTNRAVKAFCQALF